MATDDHVRRYCDQPVPTIRVLRPDLPSGRLQAIRQLSTKWVNATNLRYFFMAGPEPQRRAVREAFTTWKDLGIGLGFSEVDDRGEAEVRIAFDQDDGSWSYVGRDVLGIGSASPTMNFGWDLTDAYGMTTALHEIGHTVGLPHEHQNPFAGIVWDDPAVYSYFGGPPNNWSPEQTFSNVLRKISAAEVEGSDWDPDSVMEYEFPPGLITEPARYRAGIFPPGGLSQADREWVVRWYPPVVAEPPPLQEFVSVPLALAPGEQADFSIRPANSRKVTIATFGATDSVMVLFEEIDGELHYVAGDDDSGEDWNSSIEVKLSQGRHYVVRIRLYWAGQSGQMSVMYW